MHRTPRHRRLATARSLALATALACVFSASAAGAADVEVTVTSGPGELLVDVRAHDLVDEDVQRALLSGLPARVSLRVELWAERSVLWDERVVGHHSRFRVVYALLDERFDVLDDEDHVVFTTREVAEVARWIEDVRALPLGRLEDLDPDRRHYVTAELRLDPLTVEELRDLRRWLSGSLTGRDQGGSLERLGGQLLGVVKGRIGLGDRRHAGRSEDFRPVVSSPDPAPR